MTQGISERFWQAGFNRKESFLAFFHKANRGKQEAGYSAL